MGVLMNSTGFFVVNANSQEISDQSVMSRSESKTVEFDEKITEYDLSQTEEIEHAFAVTVHKSQGSEYPCVILPLFDAPGGLLTRNMLYTAVTRARKMVIVAGREETLRRMRASLARLEAEA